MTEKNTSRAPITKPKKRRWKLSDTIIVAIIGAITTIVVTLIPYLVKEKPVLVTSTEAPSVNSSVFNPHPDSLDYFDRVGVPMRLVPEGEFIMGSNAEEGFAKCQEYRTDCLLDWYTDESPSHSVYLNKFYIDKFEVTNKLYKNCVNSGACNPPEKISSETRSNYYESSNFDNYPVTYIDWYKAKAYCEWRGARLPTEAEWEKAARGTDGRILPWGEGLDCNHANYWRSNTDGACKGDTVPVGSYENGKSPYGVYDMLGNVWEWVSSLYLPYPYDVNDGREDLSASGLRVAHGDSFINFDVYIRTTDRINMDPLSTDSDFGIRCARSVP